MNKNTLLTVAGLGLLAYFLLRRKKVVAKEIGQSQNTPPSTKIVEGLDKGTVARTTRSLRAEGVRVPKRKLIKVDDIVVPKKAPIYISPANLIPDVYDRGVGKPIDNVNFDSESNSFYNVSGVCSENMQRACKCASERTGKYQLDIPKLP